MATAKKLPSGSWRCLAYSHTERIYDEKTKKWKNKRIYESFTDDDPSPAGRKRAELAAAQFQADRKKHISKHEPCNMTLGEGIDAYIESRTALRSPSTIQGYRRIRKSAFPDLMDLKLSDLDGNLLIEALNDEARRNSANHTKKPQPISPKTLRNEWGLITAVLRRYRKDLIEDLEGTELPQVPDRVPELIPADVILRIVKGRDIELPVLLAAWLSFSMSEVRGLTKSKSIRGDYISSVEVIIDVDGKPLTKSLGKNPSRNRRHHIPPYIKELIDRVDGDVLVPMSGISIYRKWKRLLKANDLPPMTFHDLRHLNASIMALLQIPDKYAQERGGWRSDKVMKKVYMQTFSEERKRVDSVVDTYFEQAMQHEMQHALKKVP